MAEFLSQDEIDALLDFVDSEEGSELEETKIKYNENLKTFYKSKTGYNTEDEAMFRYYYERLNLYEQNIAEMKKSINNNQEKINKIKTEHFDLFIKFSEELL